MSIPVLARFGNGSLRRSGTVWSQFDAEHRERATIVWTRGDGSPARATRITLDGKIALVAQNLPRVSAVDTDGDGIRDALGLLSEANVSNLITYSDALSNWSAVSGTPTTSDAAATCGDIDLCLVGDDDGAVQEQLGLTFTYTGDGTKTFAFVVKKGTSVAASGSQVGIYDSTAPAWRARIDFTSWTGNTPNYTVSAGTLVTVEPLADGVWLFTMLATGVVAANTNRALVIPAVTGSQTGNIYLGGVDTKNETSPTSIIRTTGSSLARASEVVTYPLGFGVDADLTVFGRFVMPTYLASGNDICQIGSGTGANRWRIYVSSASLISSYLQAGSAVSANLAPLAAVGAVQTIVAQMRNGLTVPATRLDVGNGFTAWSSNASGPLTGWTGQQLQIAYSSASASRLRAPLLDLIIARGQWSMAEMATLL